MGPKPLAILMTFVLTNLPIVLFDSLVITEYKTHNLHAVALALSVVFQLAYNTFMLITSITNPGIIPKLEVDMSLLSRISRARPKNFIYLGNFRSTQSKHTF